MFKVNHKGDFVVAVGAVLAILFLQSPMANAADRYQNGAMQDIQTGQVVGVRKVQVQTQTQQGQWASSAVGAAVGGAIANKMGNGSGRWVATAVGGLLGGMGGNAIHNAMSTEEGEEVLVRMDNGRTVAITQAESRLSRGQRVMLVGNGGNARVVPEDDWR